MLKFNQTQDYDSVNFEKKWSFFAKSDPLPPPNWHKNQQHTHRGPEFVHFCSFTRTAERGQCYAKCKPFLNMWRCTLTGDSNVPSLRSILLYLWKIQKARFCSFLQKILLKILPFNMFNVITIFDWDKCKNWFPFIYENCVSLVNPLFISCAVYV